MLRKECIKVLRVNIYCLDIAHVYMLMQFINAKDGLVGGKEGGEVVLRVAWRELEGSIWLQEVEREDLIS